MGWVYWVLPLCNQIQKGKGQCGRGCYFRKNNLLLTCLDFHVLGLEEIKELYHTNTFFSPILASVPLKKYLMISICMMVTCLKLKKIAYPSRLFESCFCKSHMEVDSWDTLDATRLLPCSPPITIGRRWSEIGAPMQPLHHMPTS
jgi:hypothetical protein